MILRDQIMVTEPYTRPNGQKGSMQRRLRDDEEIESGEAFKARRETKRQALRAEWDANRINNRWSEYA